MAFRWLTNDGPTFNAGLVALYFSRGSGPVLLRDPIFLLLLLLLLLFFFFFLGGGGGGQPPVLPLDLCMERSGLFICALKVWPVAVCSICLFNMDLLSFEGQNFLINHIHVVHDTPEIC